MPIINETFPVETSLFFDITVEELKLVFEGQTFHQFSWFGGPLDLFEKLHTRRKTGISSISLATRKKTFGNNKNNADNGKAFWSFVLSAVEDKILLLLLIAGLISLLIGIYQDFHEKTRYHFIEGIAICVAVAVIILITGFNDFRRERQFQSLNRKKNECIIKVHRDGTSKISPIDDIVVGDIVLLEPGDVVPADGVLVSEIELKCDESTITGESEQVTKLFTNGSIFLYSGSKVSEGSGEMLVLAVGSNSTNGQIIESMQVEKEITPLQQKLNVVAEIIAKIGISAGVALFLIGITKLLFISKHASFTFTEFIFNCLHIFIQSLSLLVVAVPEGLPLAIALVLAYSTTKMLEDKNLVRVMSACETMGNATVICTDKTGTLTTNNMRVVSGIVCNEQSDIACTNWLLLSEDAKRLISHALAINSTAYESISSNNLEITFIGSKTEAALLNMVKNLGYDYNEIREATKFTKVIPFSSKTKVMHTIVESEDGTPIMYSKGAPEVILTSCKYYVDSEQNVKKINKEMSLRFQDCIERMSQNSLRTIAFGYKIFKGRLANSEVDEDLTLIGIVGIEDPLRDEIEASILNCHNAGVKIIMVTGDNMETAKSIGRKSGILSNDGIVLQGQEFRILSDDEFLQVIPKLSIIARSSPVDKQILVKRLKDLGEVVAVTGDGSNDGPALKAADVGFSMGICGTEIAKEASSIVLMEDDFSSIVCAIKWGRSINESIRKFIQFQLCVTISTIVLTLGTSIFSAPMFSAIQLLWINLIIDTFAALALSSDIPSSDLLKDKPQPRNSPLITSDMWYIILSESFLQVVVIFLLHFLWNSSISYNTFVMLLLFNLINCRSATHKHLNVFKNISSNMIFIFIFLLIFIGQIIVMLFVRGIFNLSVQLSLLQWFISILIGSTSLLIGLLVRLVASKMHPSIQLTEIEIENENVNLLWSSTLKDVRTQLQFYNLLRKNY